MVGERPKRSGGRNNNERSECQVRAGGRELPEQVHVKEGASEGRND